MKKIALLAATAVSFTMMAQSAHAWRATSSLQVTQNNTMRDIRAEVERQGRSIVQALRMHAGEGSAYADKQIEAQKRFTDSAQQNAVQRLRDEFRAKAESGQFDPNPYSCLLAGLFAEDGATGGGAGVPGAGSSVGARVMEDLSGGDEKVRAGGAELAVSVIQSIAPYKGRADGTTNFAPLFENPTLDLSQENGQEIVTRLVRNMIDSTPPRPVTSAEMSTPEGAARAAKQQEVSARNSAAAEILAMRINMIEPLVSSESYMPFVQKSAYNREVPDMISEMQAIDIRTVFDYAPKPEAMKERERKNERALMMDLLNIMAINTRIAYLSLEMQTRQATVDAAILASLNN